MTTDIPLLRPADKSTDRPRVSTGGTGNAFGQLLRSMERDMWHNAESALATRSPAWPTPDNMAIVSSRAGAPGIAEPNTVSAAPPPSSPVAAVATCPRVVASSTQAGAPVVLAPREYAARPASAYPAPCPPPLLERFGQPGAKATDSTERVADAARGRDAPGANVAPPPTAVPFRVTVLPGNGVPFVSLRVGQADPEDLETLDSHLRTALQQSGYPVSKLVINGIDRNALGETSHGD